MDILYKTVRVQQNITSFSNYETGSQKLLVVLPARGHAWLAGSAQLVVIYETLRSARQLWMTSRNFTPHKLN